MRPTNPRAMQLQRLPERHRTNSATRSAVVGSAITIRRAFDAVGAPTVLISHFRHTAEARSNGR